MSSGTTSSDRLTEALDSVVAEDAQQGRLDDTEIQRLVVLSRDAAYQRSERVPVKTVEVFEPRSLVSIAMDAQRRREAEMRTAAAAGAVIDGDDAAAEAAEGEAVGSDQPAELSTSEPAEDGSSLPAAGENEMAPAGADATEDEADNGEPDGDGTPTQGTSQIDFEAGRAEGIEEGRRLGVEEGHAKGVEEGRAAGRAEASAQLERAIQAFEAAAETLGGLTKIDTSQLGESIHDTILTLASERAGRAIVDQPDAFADRIEGLLDTIRTASGRPVIHLNPGDLGSIKPLVETREKLRHCSFVAEPGLAAGDLTVSVGTIGIDDILHPASRGSDVAEQAADDAPAPETALSEDLPSENPDPAMPNDDSLDNGAESAAKPEDETPVDEAASEGGGADDSGVQAGGTDE
uniref:Flagellar assembly protein FliH/Type III secretion system HrpE domain-containing protein n=1 Tax=uncultured bacterium BAC17H8 TaxID=332980 RepID=Q4JMR6_9BACT|nr:unknown [uncultured bacterium BAC17H8]